jgi:hypothetical protein
MLDHKDTQEATPCERTVGVSFRRPEVGAENGTEDERWHSPPG